MYPIYPIKEESCRSFYGMPVVVMMQDGSGHFGILRGINGEKLYLNGEPDASNGKTGLHSRRIGRSGTRKARTKAADAATRRSRKAGTNAIGGGQASGTDNANPATFFASGFEMPPDPEMLPPGTGKHLVLDLSRISGLFLTMP